MIKNALLIIVSTYAFGWFTYICGAAGNHPQTELLPNPMRYLHETIVQERFIEARQFMERDPNITSEQVMFLETALHKQASFDARNYMSEWYIAKMINQSISFTDVVTVYVDRTLPSLLENISSRHRMSKKQALQSDDFFRTISNTVMLTIDYIKMYMILEMPLRHVPSADEQDLATYETEITEKFLAALRNNAPILTLHQPHEALDSYWQSLSAINLFFNRYIQKKRAEQLEFQSSLCTLS